MLCLSLAVIGERTAEELVWRSPAVDRDEVSEDST